MRACDNLDFRQTMRCKPASLQVRNEEAVSKAKMYVQTVAYEPEMPKRKRKTFNRVMDNRDRAIPHIIIVIYFYLCVWSRSRPFAYSFALFRCMECITVKREPVSAFNSLIMVYLSV